MAERTSALGRLLAEWDEAHGPVDEETAAWAAAQFDSVDRVDRGAEHPPARILPLTS